MADDDDTSDAVGPDELFAPTGPRRSNFTPPTNDAQTLEAANNLFNDDAIAAALAAELAKVASGPIPIIRPQVSSTPQVTSTPQAVVPAPEPPASISETVSAQSTETPGAPIAEPDEQPAPYVQPASATELSAADLQWGAADPVSQPVAEPVAQPVPEAWTPTDEPQSSAPDASQVEHDSAAPIAFEQSYPTWAPVGEPEHDAGSDTVAESAQAAEPAPGTPVADQAYFAPPPTDFGTPITPDAPDLGTVWSLDDNVATPASAPLWGEPVASESVASELAPPEPANSEPIAPEPIVPEPIVPPSPFAPEARDYYRASPEPDIAAAPADTETVAPVADAPGAPSAPDGFAYQPVEDAPRVPSPVFPGTPAGLFVPTSMPLPTPDEARQPWPPAPEAASAAVDQPPPYLGAPAPTVPAADAPPPPGYEAPTVATPPPPAAEEVPGPGSETLSAIQQLEAELERHQRAQDVPPPPSGESEPQAEARPIDPFGGFTSVPAAHPSAPEDQRVSFEPVASPEPHDGAAPNPAEPSLAGTAFDDLFTAPAAGDASPPEPDVTPAPFPGFDAPAAVGDQLLDIPTPGASLPPQADHGVDAPVFLEPHPVAEQPVVAPLVFEPPALVEPPAPTTPSGDPFAQDLGLVEERLAPQPESVPVSPEPGATAPSDVPPPPATGTPAHEQAPPPPFGFESLVTGEGNLPEAPPPPSSWPTPAAHIAPPPFEDPAASAVAASAPDAPAPAQAAPAPIAAPWLDAPPPPAGTPAGSTGVPSASVAAPPAPSDSDQPIPGLVFPLESNAEAPPPVPPAEEEPEGKRPFGEGVGRASAIDPGSELLTVPATLSATRVAEGTALARQRVFAVEPMGLEPTPLDHRVARSARLFWLWFAPNSSIVAVAFGAMVFALGVSLRQAIVATLAGVALSFLPLGLGTLAGKRSGQPTMVVSRATFGILGNIVPAVIALVSRVFWAAALIWILGSGSADILVGAHLAGEVALQPLTLVFVLLGSVIALIVACFGYALMVRAQLVISVAAAVLGAGFITLTADRVHLQTALSRGDGSWILAVTGAVLVFSFVGLAWANSSSDLARYQRRESSGAASMLWATFGAAVPSFALIGYGTLLAASNPRLAAHLASNPLDALGALLPAWYPVPLLAVTGLSLVSGAVVAIYSGGFAAQAVGLRVRRPLATLIVAALVLAVSIVLAVGTVDFSQLFREFATTVAVPVSAWAGIFGAEIMIRNRRFETRSLLRRGGVYTDVRWPNLIALVVISVVGLGFTSATVSWLSWEGFLFSAARVPLSGDLGRTDLGVLVALVLGLVFPLVAGIPAIRKQERAERGAE